MFNRKKLNQERLERVEAIIKQSGVQDAPRPSEEFWKNFDLRLNKKIDALEEKKQNRFIFNADLAWEKLGHILRPILAPKYAPVFALVMILLFISTAPTLRLYRKLSLQPSMNTATFTAADRELLDDLVILDEISNNELSTPAPLDNEEELQNEMDELDMLDMNYSQGDPA